MGPVVGQWEGHRPHPRINFTILWGLWWDSGRVTGPIKKKSLQQVVFKTTFSFPFPTRPLVSDTGKMHRDIICKASMLAIIDHAVASTACSDQPRIDVMTRPRFKSGPEPGDSFASCVLVAMNICRIRSHSWEEVFVPN